LHPAAALQLGSTQPGLRLARTAIVLLSITFAWTAFRSAGVAIPDLAISVLALSLILALLHRSQAPRLDPLIRWPLVILTAWPVIQLVPLPFPLLAAISPARAAIARAAGHSCDPLTAFPPGTYWELLRLAGSILIFLIVRELMWRFSDRRTPWIVAAPFVFASILEAILGIAQFYSGAAGSGAHGTYASRDHFAGLVEMALPFPVMYGLAALRRARTRFHTHLRPALVACAAFAAAGVLLLASVVSLSRMGFIAALFALAVLALSRLPHKRWLFALPAAAVLLFIYLPPNELIARFAELSTAGKIASQDRLDVWSQTIPLIRDYPLTGCGLGAFESAFMRYKLTTPLTTDNYAHNDFLQYAAELGLPAFLLGLLLIAAIFTSASRSASQHSSPSGRALSLACISSMSALLLHSTVDFNSYVPANAFAFAWVAAIGISTRFSSRPVKTPSSTVCDLSRSLM